MEAKEFTTAIRSSVSSVFQTQVCIAYWETLTPTQQFLDLLQATPGVVYRISRGDDGKISQVFWTYDFCVELWKKNPEVWSLDSTYKINRFKMPLLQICGLTGMHTTYNVGYCLLSGEGEGNFT